MLEVAANEMNSMMTSEFHFENTMALKKFQELNIEILTFPKEVTFAGKKALEEVLLELSEKSNDFKIVKESIQNYLAASKKWSEVSLQYYLNER